MLWDQRKVQIVRCINSLLHPLLIIFAAPFEGLFPPPLQPSRTAAEQRTDCAYRHRSTSRLDCKAKVHILVAMHGCTTLCESITERAARAADSQLRSTRLQDPQQAAVSVAISVYALHLIVAVGVEVLLGFLPLLAAVVNRLLRLPLVALLGVAEGAERPHGRLCLVLQQLQLLLHESHHQGQVARLDGQRVVPAAQQLLQVVAVGHEALHGGLGQGQTHG